jgi:hypothetical protein
VSAALDDLKSSGGFDLVRAFELVDQLDRASRGHWRKATHEYHTGPGRLTNLQADRLWTGVGEYVVQLAEAYEWCLASYATGASGSAGLAGQFVRIIARALRLRVWAHSWDHVRYTSLFGRWAEVYRLYQLAENRGCAEQKVVLYRGGRFCTIEQEFMQALMLAVAAPHSMRPEQLDVADRITARLAHYFSLSNSKTNRPYYFDPASGKPPMREQPGIRPPFTARRFGPGEAAAELKRLAERAKAGDVRLSELGVDRHSDEIVLPTLLHLLRYWSEAPPERRHVRRREPHRISVVYGFDEVVSKVGNVPSAYPFVSSQEVWLLENSAAGGFGALAAKPQAAWASVGALVAYKATEASIWSLGIVRHLTDEQSDRALGVEFVAEGGVAVSLAPEKAQPDTGQERLGVWLAQHASKDSSPLKLLLPPGTYRASCPLRMSVHARSYVLRPHSLVEDGPDYQICLYAVNGGV